MPSVGTKIKTSFKVWSIPQVETWDLRLRMSLLFELNLKLGGSQRGDFVCIYVITYLLRVPEVVASRKAFSAHSEQVVEEQKQREGGSAQHSYEGLQ